VSHLETWIERCSKTPRGQIFLDNLGIDLDFSFLRASDLRRFVRGLDAAMGDPLVASDTEPFVKAADLAIKKTSLYLCGRRQNRSRRAMACVFQLDRFISGLWFDLTPIGGYGDLDGPEQILGRIQSAGGLSAILRSGAALRGRVPVVWLAFDDEMSDLLAKAAANRKADAVRDGLGLLHYKEDYYLCRMVIPVRDVAGLRKHRPSGFDAGPNLVFRANRLKETVGRAIHLRSQSASVRELVANPISIGGDYVIEGLGRLGRSSAFSWETLAAKTSVRRISRTVIELRKAAR
jgi:hypothetical protein